MNLDLKGGGKFRVDQQHKMNRNFRKEEGDNKKKTPSKQNEIKSNSLPTVRNMILHCTGSIGIINHGITPTGRGLASE